MANVRLKAKNWELVHHSILTEIKYQSFLATKKKHELLKLPIAFKNSPGTLDQKVAEMHDTILADIEYKNLHPEAEVQNGKTPEELEELKSQLIILQYEIDEINRKIKKLQDIIYFVGKASEKQDTFLDKEAVRPIILNDKEKSPDFEEATPEEDFAWRTMDSWGY